MWVKICAITNLDDALMAVEAGADAVGFVLAPSKRQVSSEQVGAIIAQLPPGIEKIGVFLNESFERIRDTVAQAGLTGIQLHGTESAKIARELSDFNPPLRLVKGIHVGPEFESELDRWAGEDCIDSLLLDSGTPSQGGGTGKTFDWVRVAAVRGALPDRIELIVAGGLTPVNVADAVALLHPWGVDVASGVEAEIGRKDPEKVRAFVTAARKAVG